MLLLKGGALALVALATGCAAVPDLTFADAEGGADATPPATGDSSTTGADGAVTPPHDAGPHDGAAIDGAGADTSAPDAGGVDTGSSNACLPPSPLPGAACCSPSDPCVGLACSHCSDCLQNQCNPGQYCCAQLNGGGKYKQAGCTSDGTNCQ